MGNTQSHKSGGGMGKMLMMMPVMFMASKLQWTDPDLLRRVRLAYFLEQLLLLALCALLYLKVCANTVKQRTKIWVKNPPSVSDPTPKWAHTTYTTFELSALQQLASQIVMGVIMTSFLHFKMGIKQSMIMQACMMPLTFVDAPIVKRHILGSADRVYGEKLEGEALPEDGEEKSDGAASERPDSDSKKSVASSKDDENAATAAPNAKAGADGSADTQNTNPATAKVASLIRQTWDQGREARYEPLVQALTPSTVDTKDDSDATALMVIAAGVGNLRLQYTC